MKREPKVCHVVTVEQQEIAFDRVQDATALIKLLSRAKVRPPVSACLRPAIGYAQPARVRYALDHATGLIRDASIVDVGEAKP